MARAFKNGNDRQAETRRAAQMMKRIMIHFRSQMDEKLRPQGVTTAQLHVLKVIRDEPGGSGAQLARACYVTPQSAQALIEKAEESGWITRNKDRVNDRIVTASLTTEGEKLLKIADRFIRNIEAKAWHDISPRSLERLVKVFEKCLENLGSK